MIEEFMLRIDKALAEHAVTADEQAVYVESLDPMERVVYTEARRRLAALLIFNIAISDLIAKAASPPAPIDFQFQSMTEANVPEHGIRNPMGMPR